MHDTYKLQIATYSIYPLPRQLHTVVVVVSRKCRIGKGTICLAVNMIMLRAVTIRVCVCDNLISM